MKRETNHKSSIQGILIRVTCEILSVLFSVLYIAVYQSDLMSATHHSPSDSSVYSSVIVCGAILLVGIMVARLLQKCFKPRLSMTVWTYFPIYIAEALLTDVSAQGGQIVLNPIWSWLGPSLFVVMLVVLLWGKLFSEANDKPSVGTWFANVMFLAIFMIGVCSVGNTNASFHKEITEKIETENIIQ